MKDVRITVLDRLILQDLADQYGPAGLQPCGQFTNRQVFISRRGNMPDGFCEEAWKSFHHFVFAMSRGMDTFFPGWDNKTVISACNDGLRPVIFKLEVIENN